MTIDSTSWNRIRYTVYSPIYDLVARFVGQRRRSISLLGLKPGERVLIVGAGTGADLPYVPPGVEVVAGDITPAMVERTRKRAEDLGRDVTTHVLDAQDLPFADGSFDAVILHLIVAIVPDPIACLREARRVLRPDGRAVVFDKFVPHDREPSILRRALNLVTNFLATNITRRLGPLLDASGFSVVHREPAGWAGQLEIALVERR